MIAMRAAELCRGFVPMSSQSLLNWTDAMNFTDAHGVPRPAAVELLEQAEYGWRGGEQTRQEKK